MSALYVSNSSVSFLCHLSPLLSTPLFPLRRGASRDNSFLPTADFFFGFLVLFETVRKMHPVWHPTPTASAAPVFDGPPSPPSLPLVRFQYGQTLVSPTTAPPFGAFKRSCSRRTPFSLPLDGPIFGRVQDVDILFFFFPHLLCVIRLIF